MRRDSATAIVAVHVLARLGVLAAYLASPYEWVQLAWGDTILYGEWADVIRATSAAPGDDYWMYPWGGLLVVLAPTLLPVPYDIAFVVLLAALDAAVLALLLNRRERAGAWTWAVAVPLLGLISWARLDMVPVAAVTAAVVLLATRPRLAAVITAVGAAVKVWPALLVTLAGRHRSYLWWAVAAGSAAVVVAALVPGGLRFVSLLGGRGLQVESVLATPWLLGAVATGDLPGAYVGGAYEITTSQAASLADVSVMLLAAGVAGAWYVSRGWPLEIRWWVMTMALLVTSPLLSTQFILWIVGSTALAATVPGAPGEHARRSVPVLLGVVALSHLVFPVQWEQLTGVMATGPEYGEPATGSLALAAATVALRNVALLAWLVWTVRTLSRGVPDTRVAAAEAVTG